MAAILQGMDPPRTCGVWGALLLRCLRASLCLMFAPNLSSCHTVFIWLACLRVLCWYDATVPSPYFRLFMMHTGNVYRYRDSVALFLYLFHVLLLFFVFVCLFVCCLLFAVVVVLLLFLYGNLVALSYFNFVRLIPVISNQKDSVFKNLFRHAATSPGYFSLRGVVDFVVPLYPHMWILATRSAPPRQMPWSTSCKGVS